MAHNRRLFQYQFSIYSVVLLFFAVVPSPYIFAGGFNYLDKIEHLLAFAVFNILFLLSFNNICKKIRTVYIISVVIALLYGLNIELLQILTERKFDIYDIAADLAGAVVSVYFYDNFVRKIRLL